MKKTFNTIGKILGYTILLLFIAVIGFWVYLNFFAPDSFTELTVNLGTIEDTNGKRAIVQVVYYENIDGSGVELLDVKLSGYSDTNANNIVSFGVQVIGGIENLEVCEKAYQIVERGFLGIPTKVNNSYTFIGYNGDEPIGEKNHEAGKLCFYEESDNLNYANVNTAFDDFGYIRVEIEDKVYALRFGYPRESEHFLWREDNLSSSLSEFVKDLETQVKSCPIGHTAKTFGYKDMFQLFEIKNGKFEDVANQDEVYNYIYVDFTHYQTGAKTAQDSLFKQIQYNTNYVVESGNMLNEHFSDKATDYLSYNDLSFSYSEEKQGHLLDVTQNCYDYYQNQNKSLILEIDVDYLKSIDISFVGVKENSLLEKLNITSIYVVENGVKSEVVL